MPAAILDQPIWWLLAGALLVVLGIRWLRARQRAFVEALRREGDPLASATHTKPFRQRFQAHLFGLESGRAARGALTLVMVAGLAAIAAYSLIPEIFK